MKLLLLALVAVTAAADQTLPLDEAFHRLYNSDFSGAHSVMDSYIVERPSDPIGYAVRGSAYLFSELDRMGILETQFFESDKKIADSRRKVKPDPRVHDSFYGAINQAQSLAQATLDKHPDDTHALFSMCLTLGELVDYMALVEKRQIASLSVNKRAYREAKHLLAIDPGFTDAYLSTGFTEYMIGSLPIVLRWFVRFDDVQGNKEAGMKTVERVARNGHYLKPLAKIMLAAGYLREKRVPEAQQLLADLSREYPANLLLRREYDRISARVHAGS